MSGLLVLGIAGAIVIISAYMFARQYGSGSDDDDGGKPGQP